MIFAVFKIGETRPSKKLNEEEHGESENEESEVFEIVFLLLL